MPVSLSRRKFLKVSGLMATWAALAACNPRPQPTPTPPPATARPGATPPPSPVHSTLLLHTLRRLTFGLTPDMLARAQTIGLEGWLDEQLHPEASDDPALEARLAPFTTFAMTPSERAELERPAQAAQELIAATLLRQRYSTRQVHELLVDFWTNHFNIFIGKSQCRILKTDDDLNVIRPNALGQFRDLLWASVHSPAMLVYLDQATSTNEVPNENYARELMELHTLSVESGYTHHDVEEVARALTGWSVTGRRESNLGAYVYRPRVHDDGEKHLLTLHLPAGGGERDGEMVLDYLAAHDWTAHFISAKLARRFVADDPPALLVENLTSVFKSTGGDVRELMRALVTSVDFQSSAGQKLKRPLEFFVSALRATGAELAVGQADRNWRGLSNWLRLLGQTPFGWPPPDGYPDYAGWWLTTSGLLNRWNFAQQLAANELQGVTVNLKPLTAEAQSPADVVDALSQRFLGEPLPEDARAILLDFASTRALDQNLPAIAGLILGSPHFQLR